MISVSDNLVFMLSNGRISYGFRVAPEGILEHLHFGGCTGRLPATARRTYRTLCPEFQDTPFYHLADTPQEYPVFGTSDYRFPALHGVNCDGNTVFSLLYDSYRIVADKPALDGLPSARGGGSETLVVTLKDAVYALVVELYYTIYKDHDLICRSANVINGSDKKIELLNIFSTALDLPAGDYELLHLKGTWAREFNTERLAVPGGRFTVDSARGCSSAVHNPFLALMEAGATEHGGRVYGTALVYSGNFSISVEKGEYDEVRLLAGINPFDFRWLLQPGESFTCPEALHVYSDNGLTGMSHIWHRFIRDRLSPANYAHRRRPTYLNSWEAAYFDLTETRVLELARRTKALGLEMLVVDDGWFEGRKDDTTSLGDWVADRGRFPAGIGPLAGRVKALGILFGLWIEPEMLSRDSRLYERHPDWMISVPHRKLSTGRYQYILDFSRPEVVEHIFNQLDDLLGCGNIDYIKWDMNRNMTEVGSSYLSRERQRETAHRYMLGVYTLARRLTQKYPHILFENCSAGGNRFDLGMLSFMPQGWLSDMSEPIGRLPIINGASYLFPPATFAAYIGPVPGHQNGRNASLHTRFTAGFFCAARGISLSEADLAEHETALKAYISHYKKTAEDVVNGVFNRIFFTANEVCWQLTSADGSSVYVGYFHILSAPNLPFRNACLHGLESEAEYAEEGAAEVYSGAALMQAGLPLPYVHTMQLDPDTRYMDDGDFSSCLITLKKLPL